jgi:hypothetical protein
MKGKSISSGTKAVKLYRWGFETTADENDQIGGKERHDEPKRIF